MKVIFIVMALCLFACNHPAFNTEQNRKNTLELCKKQFKDLNIIGADWWNHGNSIIRVECLFRQNSKLINVSLEEFKTGGKVEEK